MFWKRKKEEPEVLDIASLINEGDQQGKVYTSTADGKLKEVGSYTASVDGSSFHGPCSGINISHYPAVSG